MTKPDHFFTGCMPALMTPCTSHRKPDFDALVKKGKDLISAGMKAVIYCGSMGDWPLLTDAERQEGVKRLVDAGIPVVVGTGAQNTAIAASHAEHAKRVGAVGLMVIPRVLSRGISAAAQFDHFSKVLAAGDTLPSVIYNSPYYGYQTRADLFFKLREKNKNLVGFKEFGGADSLNYACEHITSGDPELSLMVGVDTQVVHGFLYCGAAGAITGVGNALPKEVLRLVELCQKAVQGDSQAKAWAMELSDALRVLSTFDEGPDLVLYYKRLMVLEGNPEYELQLMESDRLSDSQRGFLDQQWSQFRTWWKNWPGA